MRLQAKKQRELTEGGISVRKQKNTLYVVKKKIDTGENGMNGGKGKLEKFSQNAEKKVRYNKNEIGIERLDRARNGVLIYRQLFLKNLKLD